MILLKKSGFFISVAVLYFFACNEKDSEIRQGFNLELIKVDSIPVDYLGEMRTGEFFQGKGILYNFKNRDLILFDSTGTILKENSFPEEGPGSLVWIGGIRLSESGEIFVNTLLGEIVVLDQNLALQKKIKMPFAPELRDMRGNLKIMDMWEDKMYIYYPGRDGKNPYQHQYFKNNPLLEMVDLKSGEAKPILTLPPNSQYQSDLHFEQPFVLVSIYEGILYFVLDNEALVHLYDLNEDGKWIESLDISPANFLQYEGKEKPVGYVSGNFMSAGMVDGIYPFEEGIIVAYKEGIDKDTFVNNGLNKRGNLHLYAHFDTKILKVYHQKRGWSSEITIPKEVDFILNIESPDQDFFALRNDDIIGEEQDHLTLYRMRLVEK